MVDMTTSQIRTVRRGTKRYQAILDTAYDVNVYSLGNNFCGEPCNALALVRHMGADAFVRGQLTTGSGRMPYTLHVHSNLWFEFRAEA